MTLTQIEAKYRVVTPLFCAGADQDGLPELRVPSFKGVLRYWWRALAWSRCCADLKRIQQQEDHLFGSAGGGQSRVSFRLVPETSERRSAAEGDVLTVSDTSTKAVGEGARYLGYGLMEPFGSKNKGTKSGQLLRACLHAPFDFTIHLRGRELSGPEVRSLRSALIMLGTVGGMGARSRKGYGSLAVLSLRVNGEDPWGGPRSISELAEEIGRHRHGYSSSGLPEFTALADQSRHVLLSSRKSEPMEMLDLVGRELVRFRSWGRNGRIFGSNVSSEKNFLDDHDLMKRHQRQSHPRRIAFGLPHNYGKQERDKVGPADKFLDRRASPLFIHIHSCNGSPVAVLSFLPARFLPDGKSLINVGGCRVPLVAEEELYRSVHDFLDRLRDCHKRQEPFTRDLEVGS